MDLLLLRHAQPAWAPQRRSVVDPGLTDLGARQARAAAARLADMRFDRVFVSTARRAQETAAPVREALGPRVPFHDREWMHEIRFPDDWEGVPAEQVERTFAQRRNEPRSAWWDGVPGGESFRDFHARVVRGLTTELARADIVRDDEGLWRIPASAPDRVLLVAHAGTNSVVLGHLLGLEPEPWEWERFASDHASLTWLRTVPMGGKTIFSLQRFSDVEHLGDDVPITA